MVRVRNGRNLSVRLTWPEGARLFGERPPALRGHIMDEIRHLMPYMSLPSKADQDFSSVLADSGPLAR
ncbi:hypothetical protein B1H18_03300 [Streptomyces tsukubensis]|uniref:Uncharacterized protein n=1 Tax=Streptomyces tsukubensis TaxID=83656 RepID=A0A1V4AEW9_9ACTN|nr:hypothetical protein B1H18_03300 [Streptomyces tsukubensis]